MEALSLRWEVSRGDFPLYVLMELAAVQNYSHRKITNDRKKTLVHPATPPW